jgi:methanogenic corrinoid protein MtbC1
MHESGSGGPAAGTPTAESLVDQYVSAQLRGDRREALRIVSGALAAGVPVATLYLDLVQAAQYRIGELWQRNTISVAQEHVATAISQIAVAELYRNLQVEPPSGKKALVAGVGGELHELGVRMTADFLEMGSLNVRYLGVNVPTDSLLGMIRDEPPDLLVLSVTMTYHLDALQDAVARARETAGNGLRLAVGGHAFSWAPSLVEKLGADIYGRNARETVEGAKRILGLTGA